MSSIISERPYPGLRPFKREESDIFFGREEQTDQLLEKLADTHFISVVGLSGCGKSSLVRAGVIPNLESGYLVGASAHWRIAVMRPGNNPLRHLAEALLKESASVPERKSLKNAPEPVDAKRLHFLLAALRRGSLSLVEILRETPLPNNTNLLILVDQFEELFRYHREGGRDETEAFVKLLVTSAEQHDFPIYVVTTMRSEYIGQCALFYRLPEMMDRGQFLVPRLSREQQEDAIRGPAGVFGGTIEPRLLNSLLNEMGSDPDQLPLLQHCLMRMWLQKPETENGTFTLTMNDYEHVGGLRNALSNHADEAYAELETEKERKIAERLFRCLTERSLDGHDIRRPLPFNKIVKITGEKELEIKKIIEVFRHPDRCFIMSSSNGSIQSDSVLDISHESLIRQWHKLNEWVQQEARYAETFQELRKDARRHQQGERVDLWSGYKLDSVREWRERENPTPEWADLYSGDFKLAMEFLDASVQAQEEKCLREEQERQQKLRSLQRKVILAISALIIVAALGMWAFRERLRAQQALAETKIEQQKTEEALDLAQKNMSLVEEMVKTSFGFFWDKDQNKAFLDWIEKRDLIQRLDPLLRLMIELSSLDTKEKNSWLNMLPNMSEEDKLELFDILGTDLTKEERN